MLPKKLEMNGLVLPRLRSLWCCRRSYAPPRMRRVAPVQLAAAVFLLALLPGVPGGLASAQPDGEPTLMDFWEGRAAWALDLQDVGLPVGESDTIYSGDGVYWSYLHASYESAGVIDQCGAPVAFPGCVTRWESTDGGRTFSLPIPVCLLPCASCPCEDQRDHLGVTDQGAVAASQQYPRVFRAADEYYMVYEWHAQTMLRTSPDGLNWSHPANIRIPGGTWPSSYAPCSVVERIGPHPFIRGEIYDCLVGAPPGVYVEGDMLYVFVAAGSAPGHMRCYKGSRLTGAAGLRLCDTDPLFEGSREYGPLDIREGTAISPYFDFRYVSSADVLHVGDHYYMSYEGIRGPHVLEYGRDSQFGLGFARSAGNDIDGAWEKFPGNPVLSVGVVDNWGIGHADLLVVEGVTWMYTATSQTTRGRYRLVWRVPDE